MPPDPLDPLFQPFQLKSLRLRNRFILSPMTRNQSPGGIPGANVAAYYRRRAAAEVALIITEGIGIDHPSALGAGSMNEDNVPTLQGEAIPAWAHVTRAVHEAGGLIIPQLWHMGPIRRPGTGPFPLAPSMRPSGIWGPSASATVPPDYLAAIMPPTAPMTESDIADIIAAYARSAANALTAGFDGIAIHGAHGYLVDSFFWAETNRRTDSWGGTLPNRRRFATEIVKAVRAATGPDFPILFRFSQWKLQDYAARNAQTPDELAALLTPLAEAGVDVFDASTRSFSTPAFPDSPLTLAGWTQHLTEKPAIAVGGIGVSRDLQSSFTQETQIVNNLSAAAERIASGEFSLAAMGRALLMDPAFILKLRSGEPFQPFRLSAYATLD